MKEWLVRFGIRMTGVAGGVMVAFSASCATFEESGLPGSAASMARNQIMFVKAEPETFGHYRLISLMRNYPDMGLFVAKRGMPDFLAETSNSKQHYYILYYLNARQAFAARTRAPNRQRLEFAGPYPITDKEKTILQNLQKKEVIGLRAGSENMSALLANPPA